MKQPNRGFTILEISFAAVLFAATFGAATRAMIADRSTEKVLVAQLGPESDARRALAQLTAELRMAGLYGEDTNRNGVLDSGEDVNDNGLLDSDWNLVDGAKDQPSLTFNRRIEIRYTKEDLAPSTVYSRKVAYLVKDGRLMRVAEQTDFATGETGHREHVVARNVHAVRFSREKNVVTVSMDVVYPPNLFKHSKRTLTERIWLRN